MREDIIFNKFEKSHIPFSSHGCSFNLFVTIYGSYLKDIHKVLLCLIDKKTELAFYALLNKRLFSDRNLWK